MPRILSAKSLIYLWMLLVLETTVFPVLFGPFLRPALLYLMVVYAAFEWHWTRALPMAVLAGGVRDLAAFQPLGMETAALAVASLGLAFFVQKIQTSSLAVRGVGTFLFIFWALLLSGILGRIFKAPASMTWNALVAYAGIALVTTLVMPLFFALTSRWFEERMPFRFPAR